MSFLIKGNINTLILTHKVLLDSNAQLLMLNKVTIEGFKLTIDNFDSCSYQILTSMGGLETIQGLIKQGVVIQINLTKLMDYIEV
jgi:hypothetical protein